MAACLLVCTGAVPASAAERYALVVTGASGGPDYAERYEQWRSSLVQTLVGPMHVPESNLFELAEEEVFAAKKATRDNIRAAAAELRRRVTRDDVLLVVLIGHGSGNDAEDAKFNLVGPDLTAREWADLFTPIAGRLIFVNTASGSFGFLEAFSGRNRVVITANDSGAQQFETVLPEHFIAALRDEGADLDKNGRTSMWEAFTYASAAVKDYYEKRGQLATERPMLDDDGDATGRLAEEDGRDGNLAKTTYAAGDPPIDDAADPQLAARLRRKAEIMQALEELRVRKGEMLPDDYERALEKLLLELARLDRDLRSRS